LGALRVFSDRKTVGDVECHPLRCSAKEDDMAKGNNSRRKETKKPKKDKK